MLISMMLYVHKKNFCILDVISQFGDLHHIKSAGMNHLLGWLTVLNDGQSHFDVIAQES